jgi:2-polyprenyl-3-methyl-5-hydroxy-6-metoxy-1,4-benzoquinol methylase
MKCKICYQNSEEIFSKKILLKYDIRYYRCSQCLFIQTEEPFWLDEAYHDGAIGALDVGIMSRTLMLVDLSKSIISKAFKNLSDFRGLDYGGGHGIFVRMMRDLGFDFYRQDLFAENLFARHFDLNDLPINTRFNLLTAFEVFEHLPSPIDEINKMFTYSDVILFSTELQPSNNISEIENWWYLAPEGGQHISFFNELTFYQIAKKLKVYYYTNKHNLHILSKEVLTNDPFFEKTKKENKNIFFRIVNKIFFTDKNINTKSTKEITPCSLTMSDFEFIKQKMINNGN